MNILLKIVNIYYKYYLRYLERLYIYCIVKILIYMFLFSMEISQSHLLKNDHGLIIFKNFFIIRNVNKNSAICKLVNLMLLFVLIKV